MERTSVAENTKRIIAEKGLKQRAVAIKAGFSEGQFSALMTGRRVIKDIDIIAIANALDATPNELFGISSFHIQPKNENTNVVKGGFEKNRLTQQSGGSFVVIDTAQGGERGGTLAEEAQTVYRRSFPCWYKQMPEAASSGGLGAAATNKHAPGIYRRIACRY